MENWQDIISKDIKAQINLDNLGKNYLNKIKNNMEKGDPERIAIRFATTELRNFLVELGIKAYEAVHLLHFCGMAVYPRMYSGCGCHENLKQGNY